MMHEFRNGITVIIPDDMPTENIVREWTDVKMAMSLILDPPEPVQPIVRKTYTHTEEGLKKRLKNYSKWKKKKKK